METWDLTTADIEVHKPQILRSDADAARAIALNLPTGEKLQDHEVHEHAYVVVVSGEVEIEAGGSTTSGAAGTVAHFDPHERHEVRATSDARVLLLLAPWTGPGRDEHGNRA